MAVREFDGDDRLEFALGNAESIHSGACTIAVIAKVLTDGTSPCMYSAQASGSGRRAYIVSSDDDLEFYSGGFTVESTLNFSSATGWSLVAVTKATGEATPRFHRYLYGTDTWTHQDGPSDLGNDGTALNHHAIGQLDQDFGFNGRVAVVGLWESELSDVTLEGLTDELSAWLDASPDALWPLNQDSVTTAVEDITEGGADQTARVGTSVATSDDPPGFNFALAETVTGTATADLGSLSATATGQITATGTATADLGVLAATATGHVTRYGAATADLGFTATAAAVTQGSATADLGALSATATGRVTVHGTATADLGALTAHAKGPVGVTGVATADLGGLGATATGKRQVGVARFILTTPTFSENLWTRDALFVRYSLPRGVTLAVSGVTVVELTYPYQEDLEDYDVFYMGGHEHRITASEANLLTAAGYGDFITPIEES